jgi:hypothetical protein
LVFDSPGDAHGVWVSAHAQSRVVEKAGSLGVIALIEREDGLRLG